MKKSVIKTLITGASLLMLDSVGMSVNNVQAKGYRHVRTHRTYHYSGWRKGTPNVFHERSYWVSNFLKNRTYIRYAFPMNKNKGINLFNFSYKTKLSKGLPGSDTSAFAESYPYYKTLGHGKYLITCGDSNVSHSHGHLFYDLKDNVYLVKMHGRHRLSLWSYDTSSKHHHKYYRGYYTKYATKKRLDKVLKMKGLYIY